MSKCVGNGIIRDATLEEIAAWEEASAQKMPPPSPQEQAMTLARTMAASATGLTDTVALSIPDLLPVWGRDADPYRPLSAIYRPIDKEHAGTLPDPIPWISGMDCYENKYYSYEGKVYLCKGDMIPCTWLPNTDIWQWEEVF